MSLIDVPTVSCPANVIMSLRRTVGVTMSPFTLEEQFYKWPGEQWVMSFQMVPMTQRAIASEWIAFGLKLQGTYNQFLMGDPSAKTPRGIATGTPLVNGLNQTGNTLVTDGWTPSQTGIMKAGDYIQIGTGVDAQLYMVTADANSDGSGNANLSIEPSLRTSPANNAAIIVTEPKGLFRLVDNSFSWSVSPGPLYRMSFEAQEVVNA